MTFARLLALTAALLAACASAPRPAPVARWQAPDSERRIAALMCRVNPDCGDFRLLLLDQAAPLAEIRYGFQIVLSRGIVERADSDAALAFLLAHEMAHVELGHPMPRRMADRPPLELRADAEARAWLCRSGIAVEDGRRLLERLRSEASADIKRSPLRQAAIKEYHQRIAQLANCLAAAD